MRRLQTAVANLVLPTRNFTPNTSLRVAFSSGTTGDYHQGSSALPGDLDLKNEIKSKICHALEHKEKDVAMKQLHQFFKLKNVAILDCNEVLKACWVHANAQVAHSMWTFMADKQMSLNTYSVACLLSALCRGGLLDEALQLLYRLGKDIDVQPHIIFCSIFLNGCSFARSASNAEKCLRFIKEKGLKEDELIYLELLKLAGSRKDLRAVHKAWSLMVKSCNPSVPSLQSYSTAIKALCQVGSLAEALIALREMVQLISRNEGYLISEKKVGITSLYKSEDISHLRELRTNKEGKEALESSDKIEGREQSTGEADCGKNLDLSASGLLDSSSTQGSKPRLAHTQVKDDNSFYTEGADSPSTDKGFYGQILGWTRLAMLNLQQSEPSNLPESLQAMGSPITGFFQDKYNRVKDILRETFNAIINTAVNKGELHSAELLFSQMRAVDLKPDMYSYNAMLRAIVRGRGLEQGFQLVKSMEKSGLQPDTKTYNAILEGFCSKLELDKAEALLERMLKTGGCQGPSDVSFNVLLKACGDSDDSLRALRVFSKMVEAGVKPDGCTILYLLSAFGRVNYPLERGTEESQKELARRLSAIEAYMEHTNLPHNFQTFNAVLAALCTEGMADAVVRRLNLAEGCVGGDGLPILTTATFNTAINACNQAKQWAAAKDIFKRMQVLGFKPNTETYNVCINGCAEQKKIGDAFHYLDTMQENGIEPNLITYNSLIKVCCYSSKLDAAVNLLRTMEESNIGPCLVTFVTLLHCAGQKERMDMVEFLVEHMHRKGLQPNITFCELVVSAYLNCHQIDDAAEALRVLSMRMLPKGEQSPGQMEDIMKRVFLEDSLQVEASTLELLKDAMANKGAVSEALLAARLSGFGNPAMEEWDAEESWWAKRLSAQYIDMLL
eukprot:c24797_g1_i1 orf=182-2878(+)